MADPRVEGAVADAAAALRAAAKRYTADVVHRQEGRVVAERDGVLTIAGLPAAQSEELLLVGAADTPAIVLGLTDTVVQAAILGPARGAREGDRVRATGALASIPVGTGLEGRVLDPLGAPLDGLQPPDALERWPVERRAPPIYRRAGVHRPLYTGVLAIDAMFPIGRGQRELVVGDEGTGKTSLALTVMVRQAATDVVCVYVAVGRRRSEVWQMVEALRAAGGRWVVVAAFDDSSAALRYLAPFAGTTVAEWFRDRGEHALIAYDELTAHAVAWRELSLLLHRPPGREAYPGDIFYLHARLLERATQLTSDLGGGSLTALPIATTEDGRLSAYIPTNLISITDGQIVLSRDLFTAGHRPAIDAGLSVSRVGGRAQAQGFRKLAGKLRLDYASFLELESFARVGARLELGARRRLDLGRRLRRLMEANRGRALTVFDELLRLALADRPEALLAIPEDEVGAVADRVAARLREKDPTRVRRIEEQGVLAEGDLGVLGGAFRDGG